MLDKLLALAGLGLLTWIGLSINKNHKESLQMASEQETRLDAALDVLKNGVAALIALVTQLVANNPDLSDETAAITQLGSDIQAAIDTAQGGGTPQPIPVPGEAGTPGSTDQPGGGSSGGSTEGGSSPGGDESGSDGSGGV